MQLLSSDVLQTLSTNATLGFVIFFGLIAIVPVSWDFIVRANQIERLTSFHIRFIGAFTRRRYILVFLGLSLISIGTGILCLSYCILCWEYLLQLVSYIQISIFVVLIVLILVIYHNATTVSISEVLEIVDYLE